MWYVKPEDLTAVLMKIQALWDLRRFGGRCRLPDGLIDPEDDAPCFAEIFAIFTSGHNVLYQKTGTFI